MKTLNRISLITLLIFISSFIMPESRNSIIFFTINNEAVVKVNGKEVYRSGYIDGDMELNLEVDLNPFLKKGDNQLEIILYNPSKGDIGENPWEIEFEIYENGESMDYWFENSDNMGPGTGLVISKKYDLIIE